MFERVLQDVRYSVRSLSRSPGFTAAAVLSLALAIGMNVAVFSVVNTLFFEGLPVRDAERLVELTNGNQPRGNGLFTYPMFERVRADTSVLSDTFAWTSARGPVQFGAEAERLVIQEVTENYYSALGVTPAAGRLIAQEHADPANAGVVVFSHRFWQQRFAGRADAIGSVVRVDGLPMTVIGVEPSWFEGLEVGNAPDIIIPVAAEPLLRPAWKRLTDRGSIWLRIFGYLPPGRSLEQARVGLRTISPAVMLDTMPTRYSRAENEEHRKEFLAKRLNAELASTGVSNLRERFASPLVAVMIMVGILLAIATADVANLFVSRALARRQESAIRFAIGASTRDVVQQFLIESLVLAAAAALLGIFVARWAVTGLVALMSPPDAPIPVHFSLDGRLLAFTVIVAIVAAAVLGLAAASRVRGASLSSSLQEGARAGSRSRLRLVLVGVQVALSTLLLVGAGLFVRTLLNLRGLEVGFLPHDLVLVRLDPKRTNLKAEPLAAMYVQLVAKIEQAPGVRSASLVSHSPLGGDRWNDRVTVDDTGGPISADALFSRIGARYFATAGTPFALGRDFGEQDGPEAPLVALVNESFAKRFFPKGLPLGRVIRVGEATSEAKTYDVIGVVKDAKFRDLREQGLPMVYLSFQQHASNLGEMTLVARMKPGVTGTAAAMRRTLNTEAPNVSAHMRTMTAQLDAALLREQMLAGLAAAFGIMAVVLAAVGLYGIVAHAVASRASEIGLRMALGATAGRVVWVLVRRLLILIAIATVIGGAGGVVLARGIRSLLFDVTPADPVTLAGVALFVMAVAIIAGIVPAWRAARIDPAVALRRP